LISNIYRIEMDKPPHVLMHFGMTGWIEFEHDDTAVYVKRKESDKGIWPPKFTKFELSLERAGASSGKKAKKEDAEDDDPAVVKLAFTDPRRLGRVRLIDCEASQIRKVPPLSANGPDPVSDKDVFTQAWFSALMGRKKMPIKACLLDQANLSGVGNWVGDEILFHAKVHPEQYTNTLSAAQLKAVFDSTIYVCDTACAALGDSKSFPENWLMRHRWGKGKGKDETKLPSGERISFVTVGGRTSAFVPSIQKKTGAVAANVDDGEGKKSKSKKKTPAAKQEVKQEVKEEPSKEVKKEVKQNGKRKKPEIEADEPDKAEEEEVKPKKRGRIVPKTEEPATNGTKKGTAKEAKKTNAKPVEKAVPAASSGRRRSARTNA
jgi:formamidopyrimidine-DNA glycosylase